MKKPDAEIRFFHFRGRALGCNETCRVGQRGLAALDFGDGFAHDLFGQASALAALAGDAERAAHFTVAAAALVDRIADLSIGDTFTEADVHKQGSSWWFCSMDRILMLMRMLVKDRLRMLASPDERCSRRQGSGGKGLCVFAGRMPLTPDWQVCVAFDDLVLSISASAERLGCALYGRHTLIRCAHPDWNWRRLAFAFALQLRWYRRRPDPLQEAEWNRHVRG